MAVCRYHKGSIDIVLFWITKNHIAAKKHEQALGVESLRPELGAAKQLKVVGKFTPGTFRRC